MRRNPRNSPLSGRWRYSGRSGSPRGRGRPPAARRAGPGRLRRPPGQGELEGAGRLRRGPLAEEVHGLPGHFRNPVGVAVPALLPGDLGQGSRRAWSSLRAESRRDSRTSAAWSSFPLSGPEIGLKQALSMALRSGETVQQGLGAVVLPGGDVL